MRIPTSWAFRPGITLLALAVLLAPCLISALQAEPPAPPKGLSRQQLAAQGSVTYRVYCKNCHGAAARGDGNLAQYLDQLPSDLTLLARDAGGGFPVSHVYVAIDGRDAPPVEGRREMPVWGEALGATEEAAGLSPDQIQTKIWGLVYYLESLQRQAGQGK